MHHPKHPEHRVAAGPGPLARLVAFVVSAGLAWAIALAVCAWLIGLVVTRG